MKFSRALLFVIALPASALDWNDPPATVAAAVAESPTIARLQSELTAARERIAPAGSLPNPMAMAGVNNKEIDLSDDPMMTMYMVGAQQTFTSGARRRAMRSAAELEAAAIEQQIEAARAEIERDVLVAWYDAAAADSKITTAEEIRMLIDAIVDAARVRYEVGTSIQADVIRAQLERSNLDHLILLLRGERSAAVARLLPLLDLPGNTVVPPLHLPHATGRLGISGSAVPPAGHPALVALQTEIERAEEFASLRRTLSWSSYGISLLVSCVLGFTPLGARLVRRVGGRLRWWLAVPLGVSVLLLIGRLVTLPFALLVGAALFGYTKLYGHVPGGQAELLSLSTCR